jgi:hypothetical protein
MITLGKKKFSPKVSFMGFQVGTEFSPDKEHRIISLFNKDVTQIEFSYLLR